MKTKVDWMETMRMCMPAIHTHEKLKGGSFPLVETLESTWWNDNWEGSWEVSRVSSPDKQVIIWNRGKNSEQNLKRARRTRTDCFLSGCQNRERQFWLVSVCRVLSLWTKVCKHESRIGASSGLYLRHFPPIQDKISVTSPEECGGLSVAAFMKSFDSYWMDITVQWTVTNASTVYIWTIC